MYQCVNGCEFESKRTAGQLDACRLATVIITVFFVFDGFRHALVLFVLRFHFSFLTLPALSSVCSGSPFSFGCFIDIAMVLQ